MKKMREELEGLRAQVAASSVDRERKQEEARQRKEEEERQHEVSDATQAVCRDARHLLHISCHARV